ncbi:MAG: sugar phosphate isomerase/epimerase [Acidobacteriia bacterium]|nr:sugar phosphate isomerase/epimerase [Terriglobia bacterium]
MTWTRRKFCSLLAGAGVGTALGRSARGESKLPFKLGIITDEITQDFQKALQFISSYSLHYCELRELWNKNLMNLSQEQLDRAKALIAKHRLRVSDLGTPLFKYNLPEMPAQPREKRDTFLANFTDQDTEDLLRRSFELARFFGTDIVRIFSYWRVSDPEKAYPHVRARLAKAAETAAQERMVLVIENEPECNIGTGRELGRILRDVNSSSLRGNWDPANAVMLGEVPYPDGYRQVRGMFAHMHVKDVKKDPQSGKLAWAPVGGGFIDWVGQFKALRGDEYTGTMSLETHYRRPDGNTLESTRESLEGLLHVLKQIE